MASNTNKPTAAQLRVQVQEAEALIETKKAELKQTLQAAEDAGVDAIVTGKKSQAPALLAKARLLQEEIAASADSLQTVAKALSLIEAEESARAEQIERNRVAHLMSHYRECVAQLVQAIESGSDALAPYRIQVAENSLAEVCLQIPQKIRPPQFIVANPSMIVIDEAMRLSFLETICHSGFSRALTQGTSRPGYLRASESP